MSTSDHTTTRLETTDGDVIAYLAPQAETRPVEQPNLRTTSDSTALDAPTVLDPRQIQTELQVSGVFEHSENLPSAHQSALQTLFGSLPVTPRDQKNRVLEFQLASGEGGPFNFYDGPDSYDVDPGGTVDWAGSFPTVQISQFRWRALGGTEENRMQYTLQLLVGWPE